MGDSDYYFSKVIWKAIFIIVSLKATKNCSVKLQWCHTTRRLCLLMSSLSCPFVYTACTTCSCMWMSAFFGPSEKLPNRHFLKAWSNRLDFAQTRFHFSTCKYYVTLCDVLIWKTWVSSLHLVSNSTTSTEYKYKWIIIVWEKKKWN